MPCGPHHRHVALDDHHVALPLGPPDLLGQPAQLPVEDAEPDAVAVVHEHVDGDQGQRVGERHGVRRPLGARAHRAAVVLGGAARAGEVLGPGALAVLDQVVAVVGGPLVEPAGAPAVVQLAGPVVEQLVVADRRVERQPARLEQPLVVVVVDVPGVGDRRLAHLDALGVAPLAHRAEQLAAVGVDVPPALDRVAGDEHGVRAVRRHRAEAPVDPGLPVLVDRVGAAVPVRQHREVADVPVEEVGQRGEREDRVLRRAPDGQGRLRYGARGGRHPRATEPAEHCAPSRH